MKATEMKQMENNKFGLLKAIGNTPIVELSNLNHNPRVKIFGKLEVQRRTEAVARARELDLF